MIAGQLSRAPGAADETRACDGGRIKVL